MAAFTVASSIPDAVQQSLDTGTFERIGGMIRDVISGRVVAFLRENSDLKQVAGQVLASGAGLGILNLSVATMGFAVVLKRVNGIQHRLQQTHDVLEKLDQKVDLSFYANLCAALDLAHDAFTLVRPENRESAAKQAIDRLAEARHYYSALATSKLNASGPAVDAYLGTLILASVAEARCYLELEELNVAAQRMRTGTAAIAPHVRGHVKTLLTSNPAAYLHPALKGRVDLSRLTRVFRWLNPGLDENTVFEEQRANFVQLVKSPDAWTDTLPSAVWDPKFNSHPEPVPPRSTGNIGMPEMSIRVPALGKVDVPAWSVRLPRIGRSADATPFDRLPAVMDTLEAMIEDMRRFDGYCAEVEAIQNAGVSFREWQALVRPSTVAGAPALQYVQIEQPT